MTPDALKSRLIGLATEHGFDSVGVTTPDAIPEVAERLAAWLAENVDVCRGGGEVKALQFKGGQSNPTYWLGFSGPGGDAELVALSDALLRLEQDTARAARP